MAFMIALLKKISLSTQYLGLLFHHLRPVLVGFRDATGDIFAPFVPNAGVVIEVELAIDDLPDARIHFRFVALADSERAVPTVLRCIFTRVSSKQVTVCCARKLPLCALPFVLEILCAQNGLTLREIGNNVIAFEGDAIGTFVDRRRGCRSTAADRKST